VVGFISGDLLLQPSLIFIQGCLQHPKAAAAQRSTILPSRQRQIFRVRRRTPLCGLSITLVETRQRERLGDKPKRFTVNISTKPSRKLAAALGYSRANHYALDWWVAAMVQNAKSVLSERELRSAFPMVRGQRVGSSLAFFLLRCFPPRKFSVLPP